MENFYKKICAAEMGAAILCLTVSVGVIFTSAVLRTVGHPIRWGLDMALLLFTWSTFMGSSIAFRHFGMVKVDMLVQLLPKPVQAVLEIAVHILILLAIGFMLYYGMKLTILSRARTFQGTPWLSYSYVNASVPVSMFFMFVDGVRQAYFKYWRKMDCPVY